MGRNGTGQRLSVRVSCAVCMSAMHEQWRTGDGWVLMGFLFHNEASCVVDVIQSSHQQLHHHCRRRRHCRCRHHLTSRRVRTDVAVASSRVKPQSSQVDAGRRSRVDRLFFFLLFFGSPFARAQQSNKEKNTERERRQQRHRTRK